MLPDTDQLRRILESGLLAPSAENKHYLRFQMRDDAVRLLATEQASWAEQAHRRLLALLSYGAVIENMALRSKQLGYELMIALCPEPSHPEVIADLRWAATAAAVDPLCHAIERRHTNRRFFRREQAGSATLALLSAAASAVPQASLLWLDDAARRPVALKAVRLAETERFRRRELHRELFGAVRFERGWQQTTDEWLPPAALEVELPMRLPFALLRHWPLMRAACWIGAHHALGLRAGHLPCALAPHIGVILVDGGWTNLANLRAGQAFQRVWLEAASQGMALQPMAAATALSCQNPGGGWVSESVRARLQTLLKTLCEGHAAHPYLLFRVGRARAPSVVTGRRPARDYID